ncbi:MAG: SEL1-like repeat protein [Pseudomonadales bacterium]|nr:SEL1-like repeat protein [Pseudomonadales bacterium]MCP5356782.1 SEL1-like repeat protein [Pseudomonadales bacterium]
MSRDKLKYLPLLLCLSMPLAAQEVDAENPATGGDALLYALAWKQTAAEFQALYYQGFNIARMQVEDALARRQAGDKPLAVVTDVDDTVLHALAYWGHLVRRHMDFFDDAIWDRWVEANQFTPTPGAVEFLQFCRDNNVEVFYVTSRDQGEQTQALALNNLRSAGFPYVDEAHVTVLRDSSNKEPRQDELMAQYQVVTFLGDNLNDFRRKYYLRGDIDGRIAAMEQDRDMFGRQYVLFPNPTDGHWLAAIFGESEPPASEENREILREAASRRVWDDALENARAAYYEGRFAEALAIWRPLAEQGNARAQNNLGILYRNGEGVVQDYNLAREWLLRAAEQGWGRAQFSLGMMYDFGQGVAQNPREAIRWYERAAEQDDADAAFNLGGLYADGRGVPQDYAQAAQWYGRAAALGHANAQNVLGQMYASGAGVARNLVEAERLFRLAAEQDHSEARANLERYFPARH